MADGIGHGVRRRRAAVRRRRRTRAVAVLALVALTGVVATGAVVVGATTVGARWIDTLPALEDQQARSFGENSIIFYPDGLRLAKLASEQNRQSVPLARVSPWMQMATVAIEDRRFFEHEGVDYQGIGRAVVKDIQAGGFVEGASTLTQQLVAILYLDKSDRSIDRKVKEAWLAQQLEQRWSKDRILASYMNTVFYGASAYGVEAAAQTYFGRHASQLTLAQSALLAGLPQAPSSYDPFVSPRSARARRNLVLDAMLEGKTREGRPMITREQWSSARRARLGIKPGGSFGATREPFFTQFVRDELERADFPEKKIVDGGLRIRTTVDRGLQRAALEAMQGVLPSPGDPLSALVAIRPKTGEIVAMQSSRPFNVDQFDLTLARRQPGSTFKPFTLAVAIEQKIDPQNTFYVSGPIDLAIPGSTEPYHVETADEGAAGRISIEEGTLRSDNTVYVQMATDVGYENVVDMARRLGVNRTPLQPYASTTLGSQDVTPLEMASAYATLAAGGVYRRPHAVSEVRDRKGDVVASFQPAGRRVVGDWVASEVTRILGENMRGGTGRAEAYLEDDRPQAGKTGTTDEYKNAWFCGYTPDLAACVWLGYEKPRPLQNIEGVGTVFGGTLPARIWHRFMTAALDGTPASAFPVPKKDPDSQWEPFFSPFTARADTPFDLSGGDGTDVTDPTGGDTGQ